MAPVRVSATALVWLMCDQVNGAHGSQWGVKYLMRGYSVWECPAISTTPRPMGATNPVADWAKRGFAGRDARNATLAPTPNAAEATINPEEMSYFDNKESPSQFPVKKEKW